MKNTEPSLPQCSVDYAFQRIGGKYKGRVLWHLHSGMSRYGELRKHILGVTHKMLTHALRELEQDGLITREVFVELPPRVEYTLSPSGKELIPFIQMLSEWARKQMKANGIPAMHRTLHYCTPEGMLTVADPENKSFLIKTDVEVTN